MINRDIIVKGTGMISVSPDLLVLLMNIEVVKQEYDETMQVSSELLDDLRNAIVSAGHEKKALKTVNFNVNTRYDSYRDKQDNWKKKFDGYVCSHDLRLEFDLNLTKLAETLNAISKCNVKPKFTIKFAVKDTNTISEELLENAIFNAKGKAEVLARAADVKLGVIKRIDYNWGELHFYSNTEVDSEYSEMMVCESKLMSILAIEPEEINLKDTVTVIWVIE